MLRLTDIRLPLPDGPEHTLDELRAAAGERLGVRPGDLRGVRHLFAGGKYKNRISAFISIEPGRAGRITDGGVGSRRYKVTFTGPGGHSLGDFGLVNPAYAMANAMVAFARTAVPATPRTSRSSRCSISSVRPGTYTRSRPLRYSCQRFARALSLRPSSSPDSTRRRMSASISSSASP